MHAPRPAHRAHPVHRTPVLPLLALAATLAVALVGCRKGEPTAPPTGEGAAATPAPVGAPTVDDATLLARVPDSAAAILIVQTPTLTERWAPALLGVTPGSDEARALWADLAEVVQRRIGLDVSTIGPAVAFVDVKAKLAGAVLLGVDAKALRAPKDGEREGIPVFDLRAIDRDLAAAPLGGDLAIGTRAAVEALIDVSKGKRAAADKGPGAATVRDLLGQVGGGQLRVAVDVAATGAPPGMLGLPPFTAAALALDLPGDGPKSLRALVAGSKEDMTALRTMIDKLRKDAGAQIATERAKARAGDNLGDELALTVADHAWRAMDRSVTVEDKGTALAATFRTDTLEMLATPVLAAVAIPAFVKYTKRAKSAEALENVERIRRAVEYYYETPRVDASGNVLPCAFPPATELTPPGSPCDEPDKRYPGDAAAWSAPGWKAADFALTEPHRYRYRIETTGTGKDARATVTAVGDLDCDGVWSTFERVLEVDPDADGCALKTSPGFFIENETE